MRAAFRNLLAAEVVSNFGSMLSRLAIPWLATLALGVTPFQMGFLLVADVAAGAAGSLALGAVVDRLDKRAVMLGADIARAAILGALALAATLEWLSLALLVIAAAASGVLTVTFELARSAWIAQRIDRDELAVRNAQMSMGGSLSETAAFALGGWLYQGLGAVLALAIDAATYLVSAVFVRGVEKAPVTRAASPPAADAARALLRDAREGIRAILATPILRMLATVEVLVAFAMGLTGTSYMIYVTRDLGFEPGILGMIFATGGIGALIGAGWAPWLGRLWGERRAMLLGLAFLALGAFFIPLAQGPTIAGAVLLIAHQIVGDGGRTLYDVHDRTLRQSRVASGLLARVDAGIRMLGHAATLGGAVGGGALATALGTRCALYISAAMLALAAVIVFARTDTP